MQSKLQGLTWSLLCTRWAYRVAAVVLTFIYWGGSLDSFHSVDDFDRTPVLGDDGRGRFSQEEGGV